VRWGIDIEVVLRSRFLNRAVQRDPYTSLKYIIGLRTAFVKWKFAPMARERLCGIYPRLWSFTAILVLKFP